MVQPLRPTGTRSDLRSQGVAEVKYEAPVNRCLELAGELAEMSRASSIEWIVEMITRGQARMTVSVDRQSGVGYPTVPEVLSVLEDVHELAIGAGVAERQ